MYLQKAQLIFNKFNEISSYPQWPIKKLQELCHFYIKKVRLKIAKAQLPPLPPLDQ